MAKRNAEGRRYQRRYDDTDRWDDGLDGDDNLSNTEFVVDIGSHILMLLIYLVILFVILFVAYDFVTHLSDTTHRIIDLVIVAVVWFGSQLIGHNDNV